MSVSSATAKPEAFASASTRWTQLAICIACMVLIANLQYGWTFFVNPINKAHGWSLASIQFAFAIFIALETWLTPMLKPTFHRNSTPTVPGATPNRRWSRCKGWYTEATWLDSR